MSSSRPIRVRPQQTAAIRGRRQASRRAPTTSRRRREWWRALQPKVSVYRQAGWPASWRQIAVARKRAYRSLTRLDFLLPQRNATQRNATQHHPTLLNEQGRPEPQVARVRKWWWPLPRTAPTTSASALATRQRLPPGPSQVSRRQRCWCQCQCQCRPASSSGGSWPSGRLICWPSTRRRRRPRCLCAPTQIQVSRRPVWRTRIFAGPGRVAATLKAIKSRS